MGAKDTRKLVCVVPDDVRAGLRAEGAPVSLFPRYLSSTQPTAWTQVVGVSSGSAQPASYLTYLLFIRMQISVVASNTQSAPARRGIVVRGGIESSSRDTQAIVRAHVTPVLC